MVSVGRIPLELGSSTPEGGSEQNQSMQEPPQGLSEEGQSG